MTTIMSRLAHPSRGGSIISCGLLPSGKRNWATSSWGSSMVHNCKARYTWAPLHSNHRSFSSLNLTRSTSDMISVARVVLNSLPMSFAGPSPNATLSDFHLLRTIVAIGRSSELTLNDCVCGAPSRRPVIKVLLERFGVLTRYCAFPSGVRSALLYASSLSNVRMMGAGRGF